MPNEYYLIRAQTLTAITNAISQAGLSEDFPVLNVIAGKELYYIYHQTLVDIADTIRKKSGTTGEIPVTELADKIIALDNKPTGNTTAILGKAILGKAILGSSGSLKKLATPTIYLEETNGKLNAPIIRLEVVEEGDTPAITKLSTPTIYLEEIVEVVKLATPNIYLETIDDSEPEEPVVVKLGTPVIHLEEVVPQLDAPQNVKYDEDTCILSWDAVEGATSYIVNTGTGVDPSADTSEFDFTVLFEKLYAPAGYTELTVTVTAHNADTTSEASEPVTIKVKAEEITELPPPTNVKYDATTKMLSWDAVEGATHYWVKTDAGFSPPNTTLLEEDISIIFRVCSNIGQTEVNVTVLACNESLMSEPSESINFKILSKPTIELMEDELEVIKLETPSIYLETI